MIAADQTSLPRPANRPLPPRFSVVGVLASATTYRDTTEHIVEAAHNARSLLVAATSVHGATLAAGDASFRQQLNTFDIVTPDGQPIRWGLNLLHGAALADRVYGPTLTMHVCEAAAERGLSVYFYGSTEPVLERLEAQLALRIPGLRIAGMPTPSSLQARRWYLSAWGARARSAGRSINALVWPCRSCA